MSRTLTLGILSDVHYAGPAEQLRGEDYEIREVANPLLRLLLRTYRRFVWLRHPMGQNHLLDRFLERAGSPDYVIANGDFSCNSASIGVCDSAAFESAQECLGKLRGAFPNRFRATFGDHELGKLSLVGHRGGMRWASFARARDGLQLEPFWQIETGRYVLMGVASSVIALPVFAPDTLPEEQPAWEQLRAEHLEEIRSAFGRLKPDRRVLLFCHDPTALPFLWHDETVRRRIAQIEQTVIGHLHSNLVLRKSRWLAGIPPIRFLGSSALRMSTALSEARHWKPFRVRLCPSLAGIELLKDGGFYRAELDLDAKQPARFHFHRLGR
jgi:hypothetical protein